VAPADPDVGRTSASGDESDVMVEPDSGVSRSWVRISR